MNEYSVDTTRKLPSLLDAIPMKLFMKGVP